MRFKVINEAGYSGYSMSNNAITAYESGEKPLSKWTKQDILDAVRDIDENKYNLLKDISVDILKDKLLYKSSWHHTSSHYNKTNFYSINEDAVNDLTEEDINKWRSIKSKSKVKDERKAYKADVYYLVWEGTRNHPRATKQELHNVWVEERGSYYIVYDDYGREILRKQISSTGTYVKYKDRDNKINIKQILRNDSEVGEQSTRLSAKDTLKDEKIIKISGREKEIKDKAFSMYRNLKKVEISYGVEIIGRGAFEDCDNLSTIIIPNSVVRIGFGVFHMCRKLDSIIFNGTIEQWDSIDKDNQWRSGSNIKSIQCVDGIINAKRK